MLNKIKMEGEFKAALPVLKQIKEAGFEAYFVGGSVRDALLGLRVNDVDIATSAYPEEIKNIFSKTVDIGIEHGTVMVLYKGQSYEITTFRTESTYQDYRRPDSVTFVRSLKEDLKRRDFTINAFAVDETGNIRDYFDGETDLIRQQVRAVGIPDERFNEDALRMMRGARFASQLDFVVEEETKQAILRHAHLLQKIAVERIQVEFIKLLLGKNRRRGLSVMLETELYQYCPLLNEEKEALIQLAEITEEFDKERQAWTLLLYFIKKRSAKSFLKAWKTSNQMIAEVKLLIETLQKRMNGQVVDQLTVYSIGVELALEVEQLVKILGQESKSEYVRDLYQQLPIYSKRDLVLSGHDLLHFTKMKPGKWLGEAIEALEKAVVLGKVRNQKEESLKWLMDQGYLSEKM